MPLLANLTPGQRQALTFGVPVVGALAIGTVMARRDQAAAEADEAPPAGVTTMPSTDAIGTGELAEFESALGGGIAELLRQQSRIWALLTKPDDHVPVPPPKSKPKPPPSTTPAKPPLPRPWGIRGETTAAYLPRPNHRGQGWYLSNMGGLQAAGGAPFFGTYLGLPAKTRNNPARRFNRLTGTEWSYTEWSTWGEGYTFRRR